MIRIVAATPLEQRRFKDFEPKFKDKPRSISVVPGTGQVRVKVSHDAGQTYDTQKTFVAADTEKAGTLVTFGLLVEIECTGSAVVVLSD
jgi:hypothetical protein